MLAIDEICKAFIYYRSIHIPLFQFNLPVFNPYIRWFSCSTRIFTFLRVMQFFVCIFWRCNVAKNANPAKP